MKTCRVCQLKDNRQIEAPWTQTYRLGRQLLDKVAVCQNHRTYFSPNFHTFKRQLDTLAEIKSLREAQDALQLKKKD